jgi:hypothetical protein
MARHRAIYPLTTILTITTEEVVRDFYAAVNLGIRTGDTTSLDNIVFEDVGIHGGPATIAPDRAGLARYVNSLHATSPELELSVVDIVSAGDRSLVDIAIEGADEGFFLGNSMSDISLWGEIDAVRVSNRRIVEYWSGANGMALFEPLAQSSFTETNSDRTFALDRLTILPGESFVAEGTDESRWLYLESGQLTISTTHMDWVPSVWSLEPDLAEKLLYVDDFHSVPTWSRTELRNEGSEIANLLVLTVGLSTMATPRIDPAHPKGQSTTHPGQELPSWWPGVQKRIDGEAMVKSLAGNLMTTISVGEWNLTFARATLAPGSVYSVSEVEGMHLMTVNDGSLVLSTIIRDGDNARGMNHLDAGEGAVLHPGTDTSLSNTDAEPVVITIIAILPAEA